MSVGEIHSRVAEVCPIHGVSVGRMNDKGTWRIDFDEAATDDQRAAAAQVVSQIDVSDA